MSLLEMAFFFKTIIMNNEIINNGSKYFVNRVFSFLMQNEIMFEFKAEEYQFQFTTHDVLFIRYELETPTFLFQNYDLTVTMLNTNSIHECESFIIDKLNKQEI